MGEGNLPSVCVVRPALRNSGGGPMLQFGRLLVGRRHTLPLVLLNDGNVPAQVGGDIFFFPFILSLISPNHFLTKFFSNSAYLLQFQENQNHLYLQSSRKHNHTVDMEHLDKWGFC